MSELVSENRLIVREFREDDGRVRLEMEIDGDGIAADPDENVTTGFAVVATMFQMWNSGQVLEVMNEKWSFVPKEVTINLEIMNGSNPGS
jgi:hypothetical protein